MIKQPLTFAFKQLKIQSHHFKLPLTLFNIPKYNFNNFSNTAERDYNMVRERTKLNQREDGTLNPQEEAF